MLYQKQPVVYIYYDRGPMVSRSSRTVFSLRTIFVAHDDYTD